MAKKLRSLPSYQAMHAETARDKKCYDKFMAAKTLTAAREILFGSKAANKAARAMLQATGNKMKVTTE
jgi:hypothetical protein